jgi:hypothetical protein
LNKNITDHIQDYFHFAKHELKALKEVGGLRKYCLDTYRDQRSDLAQTKHKLFETRNVEKWQCKDIQFDEPVNEVLSSVKLAYKYILPNETRKLREMKSVCEFASYQQIAEYL